MTAVHVLTLTVVSFAVALSHAAASTTTTLVLADDEQAISKSHSRFFKDLEARGHDLTFVLADDATVSVSNHGVNAFDNLVVFSPAAEDFLGKLDSSSIVDFIRNGGNVLVAAAGSEQGAGGTSWLVQELALQCGVVLAEDGTMVVLPSADGEEKVTFETSDWTRHKTGELLMAGLPQNPIAYRGIAMRPRDESSKNHMVILSAPQQAYSVDASGSKVAPFPSSVISQKKKKKKKKKKSKTNKEVGDSLELGLVLGLETQSTGSRVAFLGSIDMCSDSFFAGEATKSTGNEKFCSALGKWTFQEVGVVRLAAPLKIGRSDRSGRNRGEIAEQNRLRFNVNDTIVVEASFEKASASWVPYVAAVPEAVRLKLLQAGVLKQSVVMKQVGDSGVFRGELTFQESNSYGVFAARVVHRCMGLSTIQAEERLVVEPTQDHRRLDVIIGVFCVALAYIFLV